MKSRFRLTHAARFCSDIYGREHICYGCRLGGDVPTSGASTPTFLSSLGPPQQVASHGTWQRGRQPLWGGHGAPSGGKLVKGDILVSNFNDKANVQGTGNTIVELSPSGSRTTLAGFMACPTLCRARAALASPRPCPSCPAVGS